MIARDPRLAGLENNPVFRLLVFSVRRRGRWNRLGGAIVAASFAGLVATGAAFGVRVNPAYPLFSQSAPSIAFGLSAGLIILLALLQADPLGSRRAGLDKGLLAILQPYWGDLDLAGLPPESLGQAYRSFFIEKRLRWFLAGFTVSLACAWYSLSTLSRIEDSIGIFSIVIVAVCSSEIARQAINQDIALSRIARTALHMRYRHEFRERPWVIVKYILFALWRPALIWGLYCTVVTLINRHYIGIYQIAPADLSFLRVPWLAGLIALALAATVGTLRGLYTLRRTDTLLQSLGSDLAFALRELGSRAPLSKKS